jgi:hypothetical protein
LKKTARLDFICHCPGKTPLGSSRKPANRLEAFGQGISEWRGM